MRIHKIQLIKFWTHFPRLDNMCGDIPVVEACRGVPCVGDILDQPQGPSFSKCRGLSVLLNGGSISSWSFDGRDEMGGGWEQNFGSGQ